MLPERIQLDVVTPQRSLVSEAVDEIVLPGSEGYLGVRPGHVPLLTTLKIGSVAYRKGSETRHLAVTWGFVEVLPDRVTILAETAERGEEIDVERARRARERAEGRIRHPDPDTDLLRAQVALQRALNRLQVVARSGAAARGEMGV